MRDQSQGYLGLHLDQLTKYYGRQRGIEALTLDVLPGEVFGFLGPNGAGKTTVIRLLLGLIRPTSGSATVLGHALSDGRAIRARVGYLPGDLSLYDRMTGAALLDLVGRLRGGYDRDRMHAFAERLDVELDRRIGDLSKGNRQKIGVVQAFLHDPALLILDEPTSGLDPLVQLQFQTMLREAADRGRTVFLSSHVLAEVQAVADRVGIVANGRLQVVDTVDGLRERAVRRIEIDFPGTPPASLRQITGVQQVDVRGYTAICTVAGSITPLLGAAVESGAIDVHTHDPDLEDAFLGYVGAGRSAA